MELKLEKQIAYLVNDKITALCQVNASMSPNCITSNTTNNKNELFCNLFLVLYLLCYSDFFFDVLSGYFYLSLSLVAVSAVFHH